MVSSLRFMWYEAAQRAGAVEIAGKLLLEMMFDISDVSHSQESGQLQDDLQALLTVSVHP